MWIARDKEGYLFGFNHKPIRTNYAETGYYGWTIDINYISLNDAVNMQVQMSNIMLPKELFPELTWENEPIEIKLVPKMIQQNNLPELDDSEFEKGYNTALKNAITYLYDNLMDVPEDDNPHVEGCKIENLNEFVNDFIKTLKNKMTK